ncbi:MAG: PhoH family protein [Actinomycetia bacterium]|nr:PhoH family protein [Actinomycetes bacterium]MCP4223578.1 PhoH family protein [Actinomycetes bacterium]MCP5035193.1 PhoH family protein [Actinomycetes bacterium]
MVPAINRKIFVLDTSVLLSVPASLEAFGNNDVVIPIIVLTELEAKRHHPELGWAARTALRRLEAIRERHGGLTEPFPVNGSGGTVRVELNHRSEDLIPEAMRGDSGNDHRILMVALNLQEAGSDVVLVTQDLPLRLRAGVVGLAAEEFVHQFDADLEWRGVVELSVAAEAVDRLYKQTVAEIPEAAEFPVNTGLIIEGSGQSALARVQADGKVRLITDRQVFGIRGRNAEQRIAIDLLEDDSIGIISIGGPAGTGKSVLALAAGLESVLEHQTHRKIMIFRPLYAVGGQELGFLPGNEEEKMRPWTDAVGDALEVIANPTARDEIERQGLIEVLPLTYIRGRTLTDVFVIIDEAQNLERSVLLTALSRLGPGSRVVLTHDVAQRDNLRVGRRDGIASVIASLRGHELFAHISLSRSERSAIAALVSDALDID